MEVNFNIVYVIIGIVLVLLILKFFVFKKKLMLFYSDKCSHCKTFKPEWAKVESSCPIPTESVNCDLHPEMCSKYNIQGYPTMLLVNPMGQNVEYNGPRTEADINNFCTENK